MACDGPNVFTCAAMAPRPRRVFVIDDDHSVRRGLARLLVSAGFRVETFDSGQAFLDRSPPRGESCLVVDVRMPGMTGPQLREALRAAGGDTPMIFITADGGDAIEEDLGMETVLLKPLDADVLVSAIETAMTRRAPRRRPRVRAGRR